MNPLMDWLASDDWRWLMQSLAHTLWIGAGAALVLGLALRRTSDPAVRYRQSLAALATILLGGLVAWAVLRERPLLKASGASDAAVRSAALGDASVLSRRTEVEPRLTRSETTFALLAPRRAAWLALAWIVGAGLMCGRSFALVLKAEHLRRAARPLANGPLVEQVAEVRQEMGIGRRIAVVVSDKLASPAVVGILLPTLIVPLCLMTTLSMEQWRLILVHEMAHIRRGDYLVNLLQLAAESLLFFNPAVWWISRQIRQEREACCDAFAIRMTGCRVDYARTLATVAEARLTDSVGMAPAFGGAGGGTRLKDRIQRLLVPGYRPSVLLSWKALAGSLLLGGACLLLSAVGARWTVHAAAKLLTARERMEKMEAAMTELGQPLEEAGPEAEQVQVRATVRARDGSTLPRRIHGVFASRARHSSTIAACDGNSNHVFNAQLPRGEVYFAARADGFAPGIVGPIDTRRSKEMRPIEITLDRGFAVEIEARDGETGQALGQAEVKTQFLLPGVGSSLFSPLLKTGADGRAILSNCAPVSVNITVEVPGYEVTEQRFDNPKAGDRLQVQTRRALVARGQVRDKRSGTPLAGAGVYLLRADGVSGLVSTDPRHPTSPLAVADERGQFLLHQLPRAGTYWLLIDAPKHAQAVLAEVRAGQTNLQAQLGPELWVRGRITGDLSRLTRSDGKPVIQSRITYQAGDNESSFGEFVPVEVDGGVGRFAFIQNFPGPLEVEAGGRSFKRNATEPVDDWVIEVAPPLAAGKTRTVVLRFTSPSGVAPRGTVAVSVPGETPHTAVGKELEIDDGQVRFEALSDRNELSYEPARMVGFWFPARFGMAVPPGDEPLVVNVPVTPAGAIYAQARDAQGSLLSDVLFSVVELKKAPAASGQWSRTPNGDSFSSEGGPRRYVATPLPLGGTYQVLASRGNQFAVSEAIALTGSNPDASVELKFDRARRIEGQVLGPDGQAVAQATVEGTWSLVVGHVHSLTPRHTDERGQFVLDDVTPNLGRYELIVRSPGTRTKQVPVDFAQLPLVVRLEAGLKAAGRVVEASSRLPIPGAVIRAVAKGGGRPAEETTTDAGGRFEFNGLNEATYWLFVDGANFAGNAPMPEIRAGTATPVTLAVTIYEGSRLKTASAPP